MQVSTLNVTKRTTDRSNMKSITDSKRMTIEQWAVAIKATGNH